MNAERKRANRVLGGWQTSRNSTGNRRSGESDRPLQSSHRRNYPLDSQNESHAPHKRYTYEAGNTPKIVKKPTKKYEGDKELPEEVISDSETNGQSVIRYFPKFLSTVEADEAFANLLESEKWHEASIKKRGKEYLMPRLMVWYGPSPYTFSGATLPATETFPEWVQKIHDKVVEKLQLKNSFNSVLLNLYRNNHDSVDWHSDDKNLFGSKPEIASVSLGATRNFELRQNPSNEEETYEFTQHIEIPLIHGSLITMEGGSQLDWQHRLKKEYNDRSERINLTFRRCLQFLPRTYPLDSQDKPKIHCTHEAQNYISDYGNILQTFKDTSHKYQGDEELPEEIISYTEKNGPSIIRYFPSFMCKHEADKAFTNLLESIKWKEPYFTKRDKKILLPRLISWYGPISYSFPGTTLPAIETFPEWIQKIHDKVVHKLQLKNDFNSVLINLYRDNYDYIDWHSDDENLFGSKPEIASVSLGSTRIFELREKPVSLEETYEFTQHIEIPLIHGSLITMEGGSQLDWQHRLKKECNDRSERINLTFRRCVLTSRANTNYSTRNQNKQKSLQKCDLCLAAEYQI